MPFPFRKKLKISDLSGSAKLALLRSIPVRNPTLTWVKDEEGRVTVLIPRKGTSKLLKRIALLPPVKRVRFDDIGSYVWELCDGKRTVEDIIQELCKTYNLTRKEAETPLLVHLDRLRKRRIIGMLEEVNPYRKSKKGRSKRRK